MTRRIHQLPDDLIARIAAGEVVERPASVLKELIENSLDAGARKISIAIEGAGRGRIRVSDDGCGMSREDAHLALRRHATSKISSLEDLESIQSFGFRGEALPSIAAVSRVTLTTRAAGETNGWELVLEGGRLVNERPVAREPGTTIEMRDLFFNTPARFKFLKSDGTERGQCIRVFEEAAFGAPSVGFEFRSESGRPLVFQADESDGAAAVGELRSRLGAAWGARWSRDVAAVQAASPHFTARGLVTHQDFHQASSRTQFLYINRRPVQNRRLVRAVYDAYLGQLPSLRHPGWVLFLTVDPSTVDVNVHPSKREVKLTHESELFSFVLNSVRSAISSARGVPLAVASAAGVAAPAGFGQPAMSEPERPFYGAISDALPTLFETPVEEGRRPEIADLKDPNLSVLGQVRRTFIVAHTENGLLLADQHAAAERVAYESLLSNLRAASPEIQMFLMPFVWEVALAVAPVVQDSLHVWRRMGFVIEPFGGSTFLVKGVPSRLGDKFDLHTLLEAMCDALSESGDRRGASLEHRLAAAAACRSSVKAGDPLDNERAARILGDLANCDSPFTCPHGRPTVFRMTFADLELRFRRR